MVTIGQRYKKNAGMGTIIALMLPFVVIVAAVWTTLFVVWFLLGLPLGTRIPRQDLTTADMSDIAITFAIIAALVVPVSGRSEG